MNINIKPIIAVIMLSGSTGLVHAQENVDVKSYEVEAQPILYDDIVQASNQIEIYPNPSVDYIIVAITASELVDVTFELHSIIGNIVKVQAYEVAQDKFRINVKDLSLGYYFVIIKDNLSNFKEAHKFLKR